MADSKPNAVEEFSEDLNSIIEKLASGELNIDDIDEDNADKIRRESTIYDKKLISDDGLISFALVNQRERYMKHLLMTTMVSFLYRINDEWAEERVQDNDLTEEDANIEKQIITNFLNRYFKFNPDIHVRRASYKTTVANQNMNDYQDWFRGKKGAKRPIILSQEEQEKYMKDWEENGKLYSQARNMPAEVFFYFDRYLSERYEIHRMISEELFNEFPDIEFTFMPLKRHSTKQDAQEYHEKYSDEFPCDIQTAEFGKWAFCGPFGKNRERIDFYNEQSALLKAMIDQSQADAQLGKEMTAKRRDVKKAKNIAKEGPDARGLRDYKKDNPSALKALGVEHDDDIDAQEDRNLEIREDIEEECPDDMIEINVVKIGEGGKTLDTEKIFTPAEKPEIDDDTPSGMVAKATNDGPRMLGTIGGSKGK